MCSVSICIPTFNHAKFLGESLRSAMDQTYSDVEIIVLDNASCDGTEALVSEAILRDRRIRYVRHHSNIGLTANLSACVEFANGEFVKLLCADVSLEPDCIAIMVNAFRKHPSASLVGCARLISDENLSGVRVARARRTLKCVPGRTMIKECFIFGNRIGEPTAVMFRLSLIHILTLPTILRV